MTKPRKVAATANDNSIPGSRIEDGSIKGSKIEDGSIKGSKLDNEVVSETKIADGAIIDSKISASAAIASSKLQFIQAGTGSIPRTAESKMRDFVSILDFGAVEGDNQANAATNKAAIQAALAASNYVRIPKGLFVTDGGINIKSKTLIGEGADVSIIKLSGVNTNESLFVNGADSSSSWGSGGGLTIQNLEIRGNWNGDNFVPNPAVTFDDTGALIKWYAGAQVRISQCKFRSSFSSAIAIQRLGYAFFFQNKISTHKKEGIWLDAFSGAESVTSAWIQECDINSCRGLGGAIRLRNCVGTWVTECILEDIDNGVYIEGDDNRNVTVQRCHMEQCYTAGINVVGSGLLFNFSDNFLGVPTPIIKTNPQFQTGIISNNFGDDSSQFKQLKPVLDNQYSLGTLSQRWTEVFAVEGTINTSDAREKREIRPIDDAALRAWAKVDFRQFKMNESDQWQFGIIAQDVVAAFESEGLNPSDYGLIKEQSWEEDGSTVSRYGLNYDQALVLECASLRLGLSLHN